MDNTLIATAWWLFVLLVAVLWVLIPFAVFGIKSLLRQILAELREGKARV